MKQDHFLFLPDFFPFPCCHLNTWPGCAVTRAGTTAQKTAWLLGAGKAPSLSCLAVPSAGRLKFSPSPESSACSHWLLIRVEINKLPGFLEWPSPTAGGGEHTHHLDATCFFLQPPPCPVQHSPHAELQKQSKACRRSSITQILCKYKHQVPGLDHRALQDTGRAGMEKHASAVTSGMLLPYLSCSWPKCTHKAAQEGRTAWKPGWQWAEH